MSLKTNLLLLTFMTAAAPVLAGSVFEMTASGSAAVAQSIYVQDGMVRVDGDTMGGGEATAMIFRDGEMLIVNPSQRSFYRLNEASMAELGASLGQVNEQVSAAMQQMQAQLANLPPEQREMMERMMKDRMPNLAAMAQAAAPTMRIEEGGRQSVGSYTCTDYTMFADDNKVQEMCAADYDDVPGAEDVAAALSSMQGFFQSLRDAVQSPLLSGMQNPFDLMTQIDGFPVRTRVYINGTMQQEMTLSNVEQRNIEASLFAVPAGYEERSLMPQGGL
jgi:hypothetical protein